MADKVLRLTLFPPAGNRISQTIKTFNYDHGVLHFVDMDGVVIETTLPYAIEYVESGNQRNPFA